MAKSKIKTKAVAQVKRKSSRPRPMATKTGVTRNGRRTH